MTFSADSSVVPVEMVSMLPCKGEHAVQYNNRGSKQLTLRISVSFSYSLGSFTAHGGSLIVSCEVANCKGTVRQSGAGSKNQGQ